MTNRDKLLEIMLRYPRALCDHCGDDNWLEANAQQFADHLLASGVMINNWRDARTDPPELPDEDYCHVDVLAVSPQGESSKPMRYERTIVRRKRAERWVFGNGAIAAPPERWMPLPKPPKEEAK